MLIIKSVWRYLLSTYSRRSRFLSIVSLALVVVAIAFLCDDKVDRLMRLHSAPHWRPLAIFISRYADWPYLILYAVLFFFAAVILGDRRLRSVALAVGISCGICGTTATIIRSVTGRTRPSAHEAQGWYGAFHDSQCLIGDHDFNSFPSGHVGAAVGFAVPLFLGTRRGRWLAILLSLAVTWSRLFLRCHHLSDVVVAMIIGTAGGLYTWYWLMRKHPCFGFGSPALETATLPNPLEQS